VGTGVAFLRKEPSSIPESRKDIAMLVPRLLAVVSLAFLTVGACEHPQDRPLDPNLPAPEPPAPTDSGDPDADTGRTIGPLADVNAAHAGTSGHSGTGGQAGTLGTGGVSGAPATGGRSIH
jgi:hypothetical protein